MQRHTWFAVFIIMLGTLSACASHPKTFHKSAMPDPQAYNAHFGDMDTDSNAAVTWEEFQQYFPQAETKVYETLDINGDGVVDHHEWHQFKTAHGMKHTN